MDQVFAWQGRIVQENGRLVCVSVSVCVSVRLGEHFHIERDWSQRLHHRPGDLGIIMLVLMAVGV